MPSLSKIGDLSCITSCLVLPGFLMDTLLNVRSGSRGAYLFYMVTIKRDHLGFGMLSVETAVFDCIC